MDSNAEFTFDQRLGIYFTIQSSFLSAAACLSLLVYAFIRWLQLARILRRDATRVQTDLTDSSLFLNLMLADLIQAIGNMPNIRWMREGRITEGTLCTAQAVIKQIGINGVALTSLAIAIHTFSVLVLRWRGPTHICKYMTAGVWIFTALVVGIPNAVHRNEIYYGRNGFWCWIRDEYKVELVVSEYLWVWLAAFLMVVLYTLMFLVMRGFIVVERGVRWRGSNGVNVNRHHHNDEMDEEERAVRTIANLLLFYPAVYVVCVFPNSLTRWLAFSGHKPPYQATLFASSIFAFSGLFNVVLFFLTRPELVKGPSTETPPESPIVPHTKYGHLPAFRDGNDGLNRGAVNIDIEKAEENGGYGTRVLPDSHPIYQSPNPPPRSLSSSTGNHYASSKLSRPRTAETMPEEDDDEEDYGRLPDLRK